MDLRVPAVAALGYACGAVPFGYWLTRRATGKDVRREGSGNIGATNVARVAGKKLGAVVLLLDALKGAVPVALSLWLWPESPWLHCLVGFAAFGGHVFPVWLRFRGGKGVATALGVVAVLLPLAALSGLVVWALVLARFRVSSAGSLAGALVAVAVGAGCHRAVAYPALAGVLLLCMLWTHRGNLRRLRERREGRL
jgi:glycerol-3-phosphate acyltransferase PlsY